MAAKIPKSKAHNSPQDKRNNFKYISMQGETEREGRSNIVSFVRLMDSRAFALRNATPYSLYDSALGRCHVFSNKKQEELLEETR